MPAGSPMVMRMGALPRVSADLDIGLAAQVAHVAARERRHLIVEQLLFDLFATWHLVLLELWDRLVAAIDDLDAGWVLERRDSLTGLGLREPGLDLFAQVGNLEHAHVLKAAMDLRRDFLELRTGRHVRRQLVGELHRALRDL